MNFTAKFVFTELWFDGGDYVDDDNYKNSNDDDDETSVRVKDRGQLYQETIISRQTYAGSKHSQVPVSGFL